ncbi:MAG: hypothetical protein ABW154_12045 [Dyella sp.]
MKIPCAFAVVTLALSGCAHLDHRDLPARQVVSSRVFVPLTAPSPTDAATSLTLVRDSGLFGGGCSSQLYVDGRMVVQLEQGEQVSLPLDTGQHQLSLRTSGACMPVTQDVQTSASAGQTLAYRISALGTLMALTGS